jgi:hypothetical protein
MVLVLFFLLMFICLCQFKRQKYVGTCFRTNCLLHAANYMTYTVWNFIQLLILIILTYLIKDIKEELSIRNELVAITICWTFFSIVYAFGYSGYAKYIHHNQKINVFFFDMVLLRDVSTLFVTFLFCAI